MSYAIVRNEKLTRSQAQGICVHNDRKAKKHSNKEIDISKSHLNYYLKKNELNYIKEFDKTKEKYNLQGQIRSNSIIICEIIFTSDLEFFNKIGEAETKRYFEESYKFICNYKKLNEKYIISAVVHLDEGTPHMHLAYIPVIQTTNKEGKDIDKICCRDFWKGRDSYKKLQDNYYEYITSKGFKLERGLPSEETQRKHEKIQDFKQITNFENTKKLLNTITLELPSVPDIKDIKKVMLNRDEKIVNDIIKPKDELIQELYSENISLHKELSKQANLVNLAEKYQKEKQDLVNTNMDLKNKYKQLEVEFSNKEKELKYQYKDEVYELDYKYQRVINNLEKEINYLNKVIDKFKFAIQKFISWVCHKFSAPSEEDLIRDFEKDTYIDFNIEKQVKFEENEKEFEMEL